MRIGGEAARPRRRMNLTPMIDVVFLLLVFFMMVSRFGGLQGLPLAVSAAGGAAGAWQGPPRLVDVRAGGVALNGVALDLADLPSALGRLMAGPGDPVVLRSRAGATVQDLVAVVAALRGAGLTRLMVVE